VYSWKWWLNVEKTKEFWKVVNILRMKAGLFLLDSRNDFSPASGLSGVIWLPLSDSHASDRRPRYLLPAPLVF